MLAFNALRYLNRWWRPRFADVDSPTWVGLRVSSEARPPAAPTHDRTVYAQL
jgi:hypothetical protein